MKASLLRHWRAWLALGLVVAAAPNASAFYPIGGFDTFEVLRFFKWPIATFDNNNDGRIDADEGIELLIEGGRSGFTAQEIEIVEESLQVWEDVPSSYASFRTRGIVEDPILSGGSAPDFLPTIVMEVTEADDTGEDVVPDPADILAGVEFPVLGVAVLLFTPIDTVLPVGEDGIIVGAGSIIDADIIIDATSHRPDVVTGAAPVADLKGTLVHEIGHFLGFGHTPLNNLRLQQNSPTDPTVFNLIENPVFPYTGPDGIQRLIGATPTMFPITFQFSTLDDFLFDGGEDLAPDDISAVSWLYPRGSQSNFFSVSSEARTDVRQGSGLPSVSLVGGHIVAWADHDNDENTGRIALFDTMVGLYESPIQFDFQGYFDLLGMWKQFEIPGQAGATFTPDYTFTVNPLNNSGFERQAPPQIDPASIDSTMAFSVLPRGEYNIFFPSQVFNEIENVIDVENKDAGTPFVWDFSRNTLVSTTSDNTLDSILASRPMFGEQTDTCPFNIIDGSGTGGGTDTPVPGQNKTLASLGLEKLRGFRDGFLLRSAAGTLLTRVYYHFSPGYAEFLQQHPAAFTAWRQFLLTSFWLMEHATMIVTVIGVSALALFAFLRGRRRLFAAGSAAALAVLCLLPMAAEARIAYITTAELAARADAIITGTVAATTPRWVRGGRIMTDVVLDLGDSVKGLKGDEENLTFRVLGGKVGDVVMLASEMPTFSVGEEVLIYLRETDGGWVVYGGLRGTFEVFTGKDGVKYVQGEDPSTKMALTEDAVAMIGSKSGAATSADADAPAEKDDAGEEAPEGIALDDYLEYLRGIVAEQEAQAAQ